MSEAEHLSNEQLYLAIGIPMLSNLAVIGFVVAYFNARFDKIEARLDGIDKRFDDMRHLWRAARCGMADILAAADLSHIKTEM